MYKNVKLLDSKKDLDLKISEIKNFKYAANTIQAIITADEFFKASKSQPIVFGKNEIGDFFATVVMGLKEEKNLFVNTKGEWRVGEYIPAYVRRYPFIFIQDEKTLALAVDGDCKEVNEKKGEAVFNKDGSQTEYTTKVMDFMQNFQNSSLRTSAFIAELDKMGILEDANANLQVDGEKILFQGFKRVNEEKLNALKDEEQMKLLKSGAYKLIVAHLVSMTNFDKLIAIHKG